VAATAPHKAVAVEAKAKAVAPVAKKQPPTLVSTPTAPTPAASKPANVETTGKANVAVPVARAQMAPKAQKAPPPVKANEKDEQGSEQKMKNSANRHGFKLNEFVVYPAHGVGQIISVEEQEVAGFRLELFVINFTKDKMTLRVPTSKVTGVGMRKLSEPEAARRSLEILTGRARIKRTMWSRRAQEYEAKINSGDINAIAEVVRDLYRSEAQPEQSYSERQLYEAALDRMMREIAAVHKLSDTEALKMIETQLKKNQKRAPKADAVEGEEPEIEEAA
jgi:CarD family transcriptional regulator